MTFRKLFAVIAFTMATIGVLWFPFQQALIGAAAVAIAALVAWRPVLLYAACAAVIPSLDLTPWSGRWVFTEFDIFLLAAIAGAFWSTGLSYRRRPPVIESVLLFSFVLSSIAGVVVALSHTDSEKVLSAYHSPLNALRVVKPVFYSLAIGAIFWQSSVSPRRALDSFASGSVIGMAMTVFVVAFERLRFCGLVDLKSDFRVTGPFSAMHTGGAYLDAYLIATIPLLAAWLWRAADWRTRLPIAAVLLGGVYATCVTLSRTPIVVLGLQGIAVSAAWLRPQAGRESLPIGRQLVSVGVLLALLAAAIMAPPIRTRFELVSKDTDTRLNHWRDSLALVTDDTASLMLGAGCGCYARVRQADSAGGYLLLNEDGHSFLRLQGDGNCYFGQYVNTEPGEAYTIRVTGRRVEGPVGLTTCLIEKNLLSSYESACQSRVLDGQAGEWQEVRRAINAGIVGAPIDRTPLPAIGRPVLFSMWTDRGSTVDIRQVELIDGEGRNLIANSDFTAGHDRWWWTSDTHLQWHAKSMFVHLVVEQGLIGLGAFALLIGRAAMLLAVSEMPGRGPLSCSLFGLLAVGVIDSVVDAPRIALLFSLLVGFIVLAPHKTAEPLNTGERLAAS